MSEYSNKNNRGAFVAAVFAMQGIGILTAAAVSIIVVAIFKKSNPGTPYGKSVALIQGSCPSEADFVWRIVLALGALPAALTMYSRLMMPETPRFTLSVQGNAAKATADVIKVSGAQVALVEVAPRERMHWRQFLRLWWKPLLGTSVTWFALDVAFYSQNLFQKDVFTAVGWIPKATSMNCLEETFKIARAQALIALGSTVPGYWCASPTCRCLFAQNVPRLQSDPDVSSAARFTVFFIDKIGRIPIQVGGFMLMTVFMATLAGAYTRLYTNSQAGFVTICALAAVKPLCANAMFSPMLHSHHVDALTFFFSNFGRAFTGHNCHDL